MFGKRVRLFKLFGFSVYVDASWLIIAALVTWTLAVGLFPVQVPLLARATYWWMGLAGAVGLFLSIVFHEMSHSLVARRYGLPMRGITLFVFGGVAEMESEPQNAKTEFLMAVAGPISSFVLAGFFAILASEAGAYHWGRPVTGVLAYLSWLNGILALFNLVPAFPLDGGRILRSALWGWKKRLSWATKVAASIGSAFGILMIVFGVFEIFRGDVIGGIWWALIGMFLRGAAQASYQQLVLRRALEGEPIRRFMRTNPVTVPNWISLADFVDNYVYRYHYKMFPAVNGDGELTGCIDATLIRSIPRDEWHQHTVREVQKRCSVENTISPDTDAIQAMMLMHKTGSNRLMVIDQGRLVGIIALRDLLEFLNLKIDLEGGAGPSDQGKDEDQHRRAA